MTLVQAVSISGGKDSTATMLLAMENGKDCRFVFADTGNEHELTMEYVYNYLPTRLSITVDTVRADFTDKMAGKRAYIEKHWHAHGVPTPLVEKALAILQPTGNPFLDLCLWKGRFPSRKAQFCTQELKRYPLDAYMFDLMGQYDEVESWRGIRRDESQNRKDAKPREMAAEGWTVVHPIVDWTAQQTVDFVRSRGVDLNPLYSLGMNRVGCMPCINCRKDELHEIARRFPHHIDRIRLWEELVRDASKRGHSTFFATRAIDGVEETSAEIAARGNIDQVVQWAATTHGGKHFDLLKSGEAPACASTYGLCE